MSESQIQQLNLRPCLVRRRCTCLITL